MATLYELQTIYSTEDAYNLYEILSVDNHNKALIQRQNERNGNR